MFEQVIHNVGIHGKKKKDMETRRQIVLLFAYLHVRLHAWQIKKRRESYIIEGTQEDAEALARSWSSRPGLSQAEAEAQEEEAELGEDDDGLDHPQQVEDDVLVQDLDEVDAREVASPEPPPAQRPDAQRPPRRRRLLLLGAAIAIFFRSHSRFLPPAMGAVSVGRSALASPSSISTST